MKKIHTSLFVKNSPKSNGLGAVYPKPQLFYTFYIPNSPWIGSEHGDLLQEKLEFHMDVHNCTIFIPSILFPNALRVFL